MAAQDPIELYFWPTPNGKKITIALEEMALPYDVHLINIGKGDQFTPEFLAISPNNKMPAVIDPDGPGGAPISIFESGAILQYLARKTGRFYGNDERERVEVDKWLHWQIGGLGPMLGQAHHFRNYAQEKIPYAIDRYTNEAHRLYCVFHKGLEGRDYIAGDYSIADMASYGWIASHKNQGIDLDEFSNVKAWFERVGARPAVKRGMAVGAAARTVNLGDKSKEAEEQRKILFGQRGRL